MRLSARCFHFFASLLFCVLFTTVHARATSLNLGVAPGATPGVVSEEQVRKLAADLAGVLDGQVSVHLFADRDQLGQALNRSAAVDLGLFDDGYLAAHPGEYRLIGPADAGGRLLLVARQGGGGELLARAANALRRIGMAGVPLVIIAVPPPAAVERVATLSEPAKAEPQPEPAAPRTPERPAEVTPPQPAPPASAAPLLLAKPQQPPVSTPPASPLLPRPDPEAGVIYVMPFITLMVPLEVKERLFDQLVATLNQHGAAQKLKFVALNRGIDKIDQAWLGAHQYAFGEIYGYVEESGYFSTDLRTRARLTYYRAHQAEPALKYEYRMRTSFKHDRSTLAMERQKLADQIAGTLAAEMFKVLQLGTF